MIKVNVIEKEVANEEQPIRLQDCEVNDVVEMVNGVMCAVVDDLDVVKEGYCRGGVCLVVVGPVRLTMGKGYAKQSIEGKYLGRIKRIIGTLTGIEVTAK